MLDGNYFATLRLKASRLIPLNYFFEDNPLIKEVKFELDPSKVYNLHLVTNNGGQVPKPEECYVQVHVELRIPYLKFLQMLKPHKNSVQLWINDRLTHLEEAAHAM